MTDLEPTGEPSAAILSLDAELIGDVLVRLGLLSHALGHKHIQGTLRPYINHPELLAPETQFVYDLITQPVAKVIDRWYGGTATASQMSAVIAGRMLEDRTDHD